MTYEEFVKKIEEPPVVDLKLISGDEFRKIKYLGEPYDKDQQWTISQIREYDLEDCEMIEVK